MSSKSINRDEPTARVLEIQRMSIEDGPGIRTTVFFKGCSLKCIWCHNPESISLQPQIHWIESRCIGCKTCIDVCQSHALTLTSKGIIINRSECSGCGICAKECPSTAMELLGKEWNLSDLTNEVIKDKTYFEKSEGGVTVSGGEPGMQPEFIELFLKSLRAKGIHTAVDTCGLYSRAALEKLLSYASMVLFDIKEIQSEKHKRLTGESNEKILENLIYIAEYMKAHVYPAKLWIRTPVIPGATAHVDNILGIGDFIAKNLGNVVSRWELCAFNNLCRDKYLRLDKEWSLKEIPLLKKETMERLAQTARESGVDPEIVIWSGSTRLEESKSQNKKTAAK
jgi:pyruvate formate lyase activating enzyme